MLQKAVILTEGGDSIGLGHITRCSAIAGKLQKRQIDTEMFVDWRGKQNIPVRWSSFSWKDLATLKKRIEYPDVCLIDSYFAQKSDFDVLTDFFQKTVVLDDYGRMDSYGVDLVINPNIYGDSIRYEDNNIGGSDYIILRDAYRQGVRAKESFKDLCDVGITLGGSDYRYLLPGLIDTLATGEYTIHVVCGSREYKQELQHLFGKREKVGFYEFLNAQQMAGIVNKTDVMISGGGQSLHELAFAGMPVIAICIDKDQEMNIDEYIRQGFLSERICWSDPDLNGAITSRLRQLEDSQVRREMSAMGRKLVDGRGTDRIAGRILNLMSL